MKKKNLFMEFKKLYETDTLVWRWDASFAKCVAYMTCIFKEELQKNPQKNKANNHRNLMIQSWGFFIGKITNWQFSLKVRVYTWFSFTIINYLIELKPLKTLETSCTTLNLIEDINKYSFYFLFTMKDADKTYSSRT